jgi:capsular exopolysaccharide synthesis family protein
VDIAPNSPTRTEMTPQSPERSDPRALLAMLWRWKLLFVVVLLLAPAVAYVVVRGKPKVYESSTLVSVSSASVGSSGNGGGSTSTTNLAAIARLVSTTPVATIAAKLLNPPGNPAVLAGEVSATSDITTNFLTITADAHDPRQAAAIANAFASALGTNRTNAAISDINNQISAVQKQIAATPPGPLNQPARQQLQQQVSQLIAQRDSQGGNVKVIQAATPNATAISPHVRRTVELGLVIGLLLAIGAVALAENSDRRLRNPSDLEEMTRMPLLSAIPSGAFSAALDSTGEEDEAFQMLRAALTYFNVDRRLASVVLTSAGPKDGKTTVAIRLALATVRNGKNVLLVDADLRRHQIQERLGIAAPAGLGAVLAGERSLDEVLVDYPVESAKGGRLRVLPAGPMPPNPAELLSSREMERLLAQLEASADEVIIDTPAALAVSDSMPLLQMASGVVLVARMNKTTRDQLKRLQRVITGVNGTIVGVAATGTGGGPGYEGQYGYAYYGGEESRPGLRGLPGRLRHRRSSKDHNEPLRGAEPMPGSPGYQEPTTSLNYQDS